MPEKVTCWSKGKTALAWICLPIIRIFTLLEWLLALFIPVKKNRISVYVHRRKGFSCNPKYIVEKILELTPNKYEIFWITRYFESCKGLEEKGIKVVKAFSLQDFIVHLTSKVIVSNDNLYLFYLKRKDQLYINTWHGAINYKRVGYDSLAFPRRIQEIYFRLNNRQPDVYIAGTDFFIHDMAKSFCFSESIFLPSGLPRNDLFFHPRIGLEEQVKSRLGIHSDYKVAMYAPTYRAGKNICDFGIDYVAVTDCLEKKFQGKFVILFRSHNLIQESIETLNAGRNVIDVSQYGDMQELLYVTDVLISDYSSCMWDFSLTARPCFVFAPDLESYIKEDRNFAYPLDRWPYPIAETNYELLDNIANFDEKQYTQKITEHHKDATPYDKGNSALQLVKIIEDYCQ